MTYGGTGESMANKLEFTTLSRLSYTMNEFAHFYIEVFKVTLVYMIFFTHSAYQKRENHTEKLLRVCHVVKNADETIAKKVLNDYVA